MDNDSEQQVDPLADLDEFLADLHWRDGLGRTHYKVVDENGAMAIFPNTAGEGLAGEEQAAAIRAWEERCQAMHQAQTMTLPDPKPLENTYAERPGQAEGDKDSGRGPLQRGD